jgi:hypothetical protein
MKFREDRPFASIDAAVKKLLSRRAPFSPPKQAFHE